MEERFCTPWSFKVNEHSAPELCSSQEMKSIWLIILLLAFQGMANAQIKHSDRNIEVDVIDFQEFEPYLALRDDTVRIVNFWATWCIPCIKELPIFLRAYEEFKDKPVKISLISLDFPSHLNSRLIPFILENQIHAEVRLLDDPKSNQWIPKVDPRWSGAIPATLIYNKYGRYFKEGMLEDDELNTNIIKLLNNKP